MDALKFFSNEGSCLLRHCARLEKTSAFIAVIAFSVLLLIAWASVAHIDRVVRVEGKIIPTGHSRPIQHLEGGIIADIAVREGDVVKKGDLLATIDATMVGANLNEGTIKLASQRARAARLEAEAAGRSEIVFPPDLSERTLLDAERDLFLARKNKLEMETQIHRETIRQQSAELKEIKGRKDSLARERDIARKRAEMLAGLAERKAASQMELLEAQSRESRLETEIKEAEGMAPKLHAAIATEEARIGTIGAEFRTLAQNELVAALAEIERLNQTITSAADRVKRTEIRAPIDGIINRLATSTIGAVVKPGESIVELTPSSSEVLVEARIQPKDRGDLRPGLRAKIRVSAYDTGTLGTLEGTLSEISADTVQEPKGDAHYLGKILVKSLPSAYADKPLLPGMTVTGDLVTGRRTLMGQLLSPLLKFSNSAFRDTK